MRDETVIKKPSVSVTMPVYNGAAYLRETIDSIRAQTLECWELIAVDDCSTDDSWSILEEAAAVDSRIKIRRLSENSGHRAASNLAFSLASGRYVARTDQDDISLPRRLELQSKFLDGNPEVGMVGSGHFKLFPDGRRIAIRKTRDPLEVRWALLFNNVYCHSTFMFRRRFVEGLSPYRYAPSAYDYEICSRLAWQTELRSIPEPLVVYRVHGDGLATTDRERMVLAALAISARQLRALLYPRRLTRETFCSIRRLATASDVRMSDLRHLSDLLLLQERFRKKVGVSTKDIWKIRGQVFRRLLASLPPKSGLYLFKWDPVAVTDGLLTILHRRSINSVKRMLASLVRRRRRQQYIESTSG